MTMIKIIGKKTGNGKSYTTQSELQTASLNQSQIQKLLQGITWRCTGTQSKATHVGTRQDWVVSFMLQLLYSVKIPDCNHWGGPRASLGMEQREISVPGIHWALVMKPVTSHYWLSYPDSQTWQQEKRQQQKSSQLSQ
jgi:hypothetical protein